MLRRYVVKENFIILDDLILYIGGMGSSNEWV